MAKLSRQLQAGFTLIELIIVITIIAILAAIALPKYIDAQRDARIAKVQALFGSVRTAAALAKARCELDFAQGLTTGVVCGNTTTPQVNMDGSNIDMTFRYPSATATGIQLAANIVPASDGVTIDTSVANTMTITPAGATTATSCQITYVNATSATAAPSITISNPLSGC